MGIGGHPTVCAGHEGRDVVVGRFYTDNQCAALTQSDAQRVALDVLIYDPNLIDHPSQLAAAISFAYNVGTGAYKKSSVATNFKAGRFTAGCSALLYYVKAKGRVLKGLVDRRKVEYSICMK